MRLGLLKSYRALLFKASARDARSAALATPWIHLWRLPGLHLNVSPTPGAGLKGGVAEGGGQRGAMV